MHSIMGEQNIPSRLAHILSNLGVVICLKIANNILAVWLNYKLYIHGKI